MHIYKVWQGQCNPIFTVHATNNEPLICGQLRYSAPIRNHFLYVCGGVLRGMTCISLLSVLYITMPF